MSKDILGKKHQNFEAVSVSKLTEWSLPTLWGPGFKSSQGNFD